MHRIGCSVAPSLHFMRKKQATHLTLFYSFFSWHVTFWRSEQLDNLKIINPDALRRWSLRRLSRALPPDPPCIKIVRLIIYFLEALISSLFFLLLWILLIIWKATTVYSLQCIQGLMVKVKVKVSRSGPVGGCWWILPFIGITSARSTPGGSKSLNYFVLPSSLRSTDWKFFIIRSPFIIHTAHLSSLSVANLLAQFYFRYIALTLISGIGTLRANQSFVRFSH